jgi:NAD(P)-dependent dehydrogenase (short-subunit alcohol dehydrogenase family)
VVAEFGFLHVLVNNAAIFVLKGIEASVEDWQRLLAVKRRGAGADGEARGAAHPSGRRGRS